MKVGTIVKVTENWSGAPDVCLGRFGVVVPMAVFDDLEDDDDSLGNVVAFNYPGIEDVDEDCWIFTDEELEAVSPEVLNEDFYSDLSEHYGRLVQEFPYYFKNCPKELPARRPVEDEIDWPELRRAVKTFSDFIDKMEGMVKKG